MHTNCQRLLALIRAAILWFGMDILRTSEASRYVRPEDCTWEPVSDSSGVSMICTVQILQGGLNPTNFSRIMPGHTIKFSIRCNTEREMQQRSEMTNDLFVHLRELQSLSIEHCKLDHLPLHVFRGLSYLKRLKLSTHNSDWGSRTSLSIAPSVLIPLENVEIIDLSENNFRQFLPSLFCGLSKLRIVNLTGNIVKDGMNFGFSQVMVCKPTIRELEISRNKLQVLQNRAFSALTHLEELRANHNQINRAEPFALEGLGGLQRLYITDNMLIALPMALFQPTPNIVELYLRNNSLSALPPNIFVNLTKLTVLDLAHNQLSSLEWLKTDSLARLISLDLTHNRLAQLDSASFGALLSLQSLLLGNNHIEFISNFTFTNLSSLQSLVLSYNRLKNIHSHTLAGLHSLLSLHLEHNRIDSVQETAFSNLSQLQELNLAENVLTVVPNAVSFLKMLRSLDLSCNVVVDIANTSYQGLERLYALNLMGNSIGNLSLTTFRYLPSLRIINLARNSIQMIEQGTFDDVPGLHYLRLDSNHIDDVNGLFRNLHDLIMLNISVNKVRWFDYALIPLSLQWLDIHDNQIEALGNYFELENTLKLRTLDASYNRVNDLDSSSLPNSLEIVFLKKNQLKRIQPFTFLGKQNLSRVDLTDNGLVTLDLNMLRLTEVPVHRPLPEFAIANNPYQCDCHMQWLQRLKTSPTDPSNDEVSRHFPRLIDLHLIQCRLMFNKKAKQLPLIVMNSTQFLCEYRRHCFPLCHCCEFEECDCEFVCPEHCTCYRDQSWTNNIIDCGFRRHFVSPKQLPAETTELYLDGNDILTVASFSFDRCKQMKTLFLNGSNIKTIQNEAFEGLENLRVLQLDRNQLSILHGNEFVGLENLFELYLSANKIKFIGNMTFAPLKNLQTLHLDRNHLVELSLWSFQNNAQISNIRLSSNPFTCSCHFVPTFVQYLNAHSDIVRDIHELFCTYNETISLLLWGFNMSRCNSSVSQATFLTSQYKFRYVNDFVPFFTILGSLFALAVLLVMIVMTYGRPVRLWLFQHFGVRVFERTTMAEQEKLFDAFVSYAKEDGAFVVQMLAPGLEFCNPPYRLCLHYRDLPMGANYLGEAIEEAVDSSRRTIVILSQNFLKNEWSRYEFKLAHDEALNNKDHKLVSVLLGRISYRELDPEIRVWLKHSTVLHWGEKDFWLKLRYAMPDTRHSKGERSDIQTATVHI